MPFASRLTYHPAMPKLAGLLQSIGLIALGCAATFFAVRAAWMVSPWIIMGPALALLAIIVCMGYSRSVTELGHTARDIWQWLRSGYRAWRALEVGIRYLVLGITVAVLALTNTWLHVSEQRRVREKHVATTQREQQRRQEEEKTAAANAKMRAQSQVADERMKKVFKTWADFEILPMEQKTPALARQTETKANELAINMSEENSADIRRYNAKQLGEQLEKLAYLNMPIAERTALVTRLLGNGDTSNAICKARAELANVRVKDRNDPAIRRVADVIRAKELALLKADWDDAARSRGILCRDGTSSPSCMCEGPRRGCCSHHGGVAGCEPMPVMEREITCPK